MDEREIPQGSIEFSTNKIRLVNRGMEPYKTTYQLQNRCHCLRKIRAAIAKDSDQVYYTKWAQPMEQLTA